MLDILIYIWIFGTLFMPYIIGIIISAIVIFLIRKRLLGKNRTLIYIIIIVSCLSVFSYLGYSAMLYLIEKPDKLYKEMQEIDESKKLIDLSKEEVITLLGEPLQKESDNLYVYDAGTLTNYLFFGERDFYRLFVWFDENNKVKSTSIDFPKGG